MLPKHSEYITIEHTGVSDKPIFTIVIRKDNSLKPLEDHDNYTVNDKTYASLKKIILSYKDNAYNENDFGSFNITVNSTAGTAISRYLDRKNSIELFHKLIVTLKTSNINNDLVSRLEVQEKRITY